ncbi:MAG: transposase [Actinobacteria bacterium]|nr:transposase [Actinomycetota bacterium]
MTPGYPRRCVLPAPRRSPWTWTPLSSRCTAARRARHTTGLSYPGVIIPSFFNQYGDCEGAYLRPGNVHSADGWRDLLQPIVVRYKASGKRIYFRADAAFASPDVYESLEDNNILYAMRMKANSRLYEEVEHLMTRPVGRLSAKPKVFYHDFFYRAGSWRRQRRVIAMIEWHQGELFSRVGFIGANLSAKAESVVRFYNKRGPCEQYIKEANHGLGVLTWI